MKWGAQLDHACTSIEMSIFSQRVDHLPLCGLQLLETQNSPVLTLSANDVELSPWAILKDNIKTAQSKHRSGQSISLFSLSNQLSARLQRGLKIHWDLLCVATDESALNYREKMGSISILASTNVHQEGYIQFW